MLTSLIHFFRKEGITGWYIEGGSLLRLVRHNGTQIPWDNDADVHILVNRTGASAEKSCQQQRCEDFGQHVGTALFRVRSGPCVLKQHASWLQKVRK